MLSCFSHVRLFAPLSMGFSRQEHWSGLSRPPPGDLPNLGIEPTSLKSLALAGSSLPPAPAEMSYIYKCTYTSYIYYQVIMYSYLNLLYCLIDLFFCWQKLFGHLGLRWGTSIFSPIKLMEFFFHSFNSSSLVCIDILNFLGSYVIY